MLHCEKIIGLIQRNVDNTKSFLRTIINWYSQETLTNITCVGPYNLGEKEWLLKNVKAFCLDYPVRYKIGCIRLCGRSKHFK